MTSIFRNFWTNSINSKGWTNTDEDTSAMEKLLYVTNSVKTRDLNYNNEVQSPGFLSTNHLKLQCPLDWNWIWFAPTTWKWNELIQVQICIQISPIDQFCHLNILSVFPTILYITKQENPHLEVEWYLTCNQRQAVLCWPDALIEPLPCVNTQCTILCGNRGTSVHSPETNNIIIPNHEHSEIIRDSECSVYYFMSLRLLETTSRSTVSRTSSVCAGMSVG